MLNTQEQKVVDLLGEAWSAYMNLIMQDQRDSNDGINIQDTQPIKIKIDDDTNDFRKAIHDGQRIVFTKSVLRESRSGPFIIPHVPKRDRENITGDGRHPEEWVPPAPLITDRLRFIRLIELLMPTDMHRINWEEDLNIAYFDSHGHREQEVDWKEVVGEFLYDPEDKEAIKELTKWGWIKIG